MLSEDFYKEFEYKSDLIKKDAFFIKLQEVFWRKGLDSLPRCINRILVLTTNCSRLDNSENLIYCFINLYRNSGYYVKEIELGTKLEPQDINILISSFDIVLLTGFKVFKKNHYLAEILKNADIKTPIFLNLSSINYDNIDYFNHHRFLCQFN